MADPTPTKHHHMDILTQIQDELDMFLHQMYTSLRHIKEAAPPALIPGQPLLASFTELESQTTTTTTTTTTTQPPHEASNPAVPVVTQASFDADIRELSHDLVIKEQQIETLIANLPGLKKTEAEQVAQMKALERQLLEIEGERVEAVREKERLVARVEGAIGSVGGMG
ncbi:hypothetical protein K505DRAFT_320062 [Melanomma pulvis-pyrius CBS 109.77]|uniref:Mediator of RNA polymerase II transcription subunit 21 n=1 Tax=Melanomma pulvis-pyrius CBS 109.77 TaxID=1314802 RepID=A0A6A6XWM1_9PLEO|nr:hypothetical protein K505DRAFT_320062 [Melanomma pulvis-pyrius CBS 109.77]